MTRAALTVVEPRVGFILADRAVDAAESEPEAIRIEALRVAVQRAIEVGEPDAERAYRARLTALERPADPFFASGADVTAPDAVIFALVERADSPDESMGDANGDDDDAKASWSSDAVGEWLDQSRLPDDSSAPEMTTLATPTPTPPTPKGQVDALVRMISPPEVAPPPSQNPQRLAERQRPETRCARPRDRQALTTLDEIELTDERWLEAATYLDQLARVVEEPAERAGAFYRQATLLLDRLDEPDGWSVLLRGVDL